jgi:hypothetical protein
VQLQGIDRSTDLFFLLFFKCVHMRCLLNILLVQKLEGIDISVILIYSLRKKNLICRVVGSFQFWYWPPTYVTNMLKNWLNGVYKKATSQSGDLCSCVCFSEIIKMI